MIGILVAGFTEPGFFSEEFGMAEFHDAKYWQDRADYLRKTTEGLEDLEAKQVLLDMATLYERFAKQRKARPSPRP